LLNFYDFFRLSEDVMLNHERIHHGLHEKSRAGFFSGNKTKAWPVTKKGASPEKVPRKTNPRKTQVILYLSEIEDMWNSEIPSDVSLSDDS